MRIMLMLATAVLLAVGAPAAVSAAPASPSAGVPGSGIGIGLLGGGEHLVESRDPGQTITRSMRVSNNTTQAQDIAVYAGPAWDADGNFEIENKGAVNAVSTWTSVDKPSVYLEAGASTDVVVTVRIPSDAPAATVTGVIWAEGETSRPGVRMYVTVGGNNGPASDFAITDLIPSRQADGTAVVAVAVTNTGGRAIDLAGTLRLTRGPGGVSLTPALSQPTALAADQSADVLFVIPGSASVSNGPWLATVSLRNGYFRHGMEKTITFPNKATGTTEPPAAGSLGSLGSLG